MATSLSSLSGQGPRRVESSSPAIPQAPAHFRVATIGVQACAKLTYPEPHFILSEGKMSKTKIKISEANKQLWDNDITHERIKFIVMEAINKANSIDISNNKMFLPQLEEIMNKAVHEINQFAIFQVYEKLKGKTSLE
jgi:hypothetical protein